MRGVVKETPSSDSRDELFLPMMLCFVVLICCCFLIIFFVLAAKVSCHDHPRGPLCWAQQHTGLVGSLDSSHNTPPNKHRTSFVWAFFEGFGGGMAIMGPILCIFCIWVEGIKLPVSKQKSSAQNDKLKVISILYAHCCRHITIRVLHGILLPSRSLVFILDTIHPFCVTGDGDRGAYPLGSRMHHGLHFRLLLQFSFSNLTRDTTSCSGRMLASDMVSSSCMCRSVGCAERGNYRYTART